MRLAVPFAPALAALVFSLPVAAGRASAASTADALADYLKGRISTIDKKKPVRVSVLGGDTTGLIKDLTVSGAPAMMKDVRTERLEVHAVDLKVDHAKLEKDKDLCVSSVGKFHVNAEVTASALTNRINAGKLTKELSATVSFADGKAYITGHFQYSFIKGSFDAQLNPTIQNKNQIVFVLEKLKVGGVPAPRSVRKILQKKMKPMDMGELVGAPVLDRVWIENDRLKLVSGKPF